MEPLLTDPEMIYEFGQLLLRGLAGLVVGGFCLWALTGD